MELTLTIKIDVNSLAERKRFTDVVKSQGDVKDNANVDEIWYSIKCQFDWKMLSYSYENS